MARAEEIYPSVRMLEKELERAKADPFNSETLLRFYEARVAEGRSVFRIYKCLSTMRRISAMLGKPFEQACKQDIVTLVSQIERKGYAGWTKRDYKVILKHFYTWLRDSDVAPPEVRWIKKLSNAANKRPILPKDLLTAEEKLAMSRAALNPRDRALVEVFCESGRRLGEILTVRIGEIEFDENGAKLFVNGKMGSDFARVIAAAPGLAIWLNIHPLRDNPEAPVWIGIGHENNSKQLAYWSAAKVLKSIAKRAGITKRMFYYLLRHTRIDETQGILTEAQQCMMFGWKFGSRMPAVYFKRYGKHIDDAQAIMNGVTPQKKHVTAQAPKKCPRCRIQNPCSSKFCNSCGCTLDAETAVKIDEAKQAAQSILEEVTKDPDKAKKLRALLGIV